MSKLWGRLVAAISRRSISVTRPRAAAAAASPRGGDIDMDPFEHATGIEKRELLAVSQGGDPYHIKMVKRGAGTKDNPTLVPSVFDLRMVGCICCDDRQAKYMWLEKGTVKRCACGHWFKLKEAKPL